MRSRLALAATLTSLLLALMPGVASAHGDEDTGRSYDLVRQAIALIVNTPGDMDAITDKINDALGAENRDRVQIPLVQQAKAALESNDMHQVRALLERSIGAKVHIGPAEPVPIGEPAPATGAETGTVAAIDAMSGRGNVNGGDWIMLALSVAAGLGGVALSLRMRPRHLPHPGPTLVR